MKTAFDFSVQVKAEPFITSPGKGKKTHKKERGHMGRMYQNVMEIMGRTPLMELERIRESFGLKAKLLGKLEGMNPAGSAKDRIAKAMVEEAESRGLLKPGATIIEPTSGNTGIGLAAVAAARGYRLILTMPETMSVERRNLLKAYGADIVLTEGAKGMSGAVEKARELAETIPGGWIAGQFENPENARAHYETTGPEIWEDTGGKVDYFVAGVGTGGTLTGTGRYLKERNPDVKIIAVEPALSPLLSQGIAGPHGLQGIGANFIPQVLDTAVYDRIMTVTDQDAYEMGRMMARKEGYLVGISSGAALWAACQIAREQKGQGKHIVVILPDTGERYLSTPLFEEEGK